MAETIKGINIKLSLDGKDLDNELKEINKELKEQQKDLRAINTNLRYDSSNVELWRKKQTQLNEMLETTKKRLDTQNKALEKAKQGLKLGTTSDAEFRKVQRNVAYSEADVKRLNNELEKTKNKIKDLGNVKFDNIAKVGSTLTKSVTVPILGAVTALGMLAKKGADTAGAIKDTAEKIGMSMEALQEWNHVANIAGTETSSLENAFVKVNSILADIALGDVKSFAGVFHALGISMDELEGKDTSEAFEIIRDALANVEDQSLKTALANHLFGDKLGSELLPMLNMEADAINELRNQARQLGIITSEQAEVTGSFNDSLDSLKQSTTALTVELAVALVPAMQSVVEMITNKLIPAISNMISWWTNLSEGNKKLIATLIGIAAAVGPVLTIIGKVGPLLKIVAVAIKGVGAAAAAAGIGINAATLGIGALIAIVVTALMRSEKFKELLEKLMDVFQRLLEPIIKIVEVLMDALMPIIEIIINIITRLIDILVPIIDMILAPLIKQLDFLVDIFEMISPLIEIVGNVLQAILVPAFQALEKILAPIITILETIINFFKQIFDFADSVGDVVGDVLGGIGDTIGNVVGGIGNFIGDVAGKVGNFVGDVGNKVGSVFGGIGDFVGGVANKVSGVAGNIASGVSNAVSGAVSSVSNVGKNVTSGVSNAVSTAKNAVSSVASKVGGWFSNTFNLKKNSNTNTSTSNNQTNNSITINTTSSTFDIDSINKALGGKYI